MILTLDQRKLYRNALGLFDDNIKTLENALYGIRPIPPMQAEIYATMAGTTEIEGQLNYFRYEHGLLDKQYDEELRDSAQHRFSPFCEYMFRHEPPAHHHELLIDYMEKVHTGEIQRLAVSAPPGSAKFICNNSRLQSSGKDVSLCDIKVGDIVTTHTGKEKRVNVVHEYPNKESLVITTASGIKLTSGLDHMWMTGRGWVEAQEITKGDVLAIPIAPDGAQQKTLEEYRKVFAEKGCIYQRNDVKRKGAIRYRVYLKLQDEEAEALSPKLRAAGIKLGRHPKNKTPKGRTNLGIDPVQHLAIMDGTYQPPKPTVSQLNTSGRDMSDFMLTGLLLGDGCVTTESKGFGFTQGDEVVMDLYRDIVAGKGFPLNKMSFKQNCYSIKNATQDARDYMKFLDIAGSRAATKRVPSWAFHGSDSEIAGLLAGGFMTDGTVYDKAPGIGRTIGTFAVEIASISEGLIDDYIKLFNMIGVKARKATHRTTYDNRPHISYKAVAKSREDVAQFFRIAPIHGDKLRKYEEIIKTFQYKGSIDQRKYVNEKVFSVEEGPKVDMRCLEVEEDRTFICNGVVTHNSSYSSIRFAAWHLGRKPDDRWLQGAHGQTFAKERLGKPVRSLIQDPRFNKVFPDVKISATSAAADYFEIEGHRGYYKAVGVGTGIAGYRFECGGIDDPISSREDAESKTMRDKLHSWFDDDFGTRPSNPHAPIFVVQCLVGDTYITMADGTEKLLQDVHVGDSVKSHRMGVMVDEIVTAKSKQEKSEVYSITLSNGRVITGTGDHPLLVKYGDHTPFWRFIRNIRSGDLLVEYGDQYSTIAVTKVVREQEPVTTYDITVSGDENFIAEGIVSHNTRWHEDDLVGHELQKMKEGKGQEWEVVNIPALAETEDDILGRKKGEGLWPEVFGTKYYEEIRKISTSKKWNSLYQGNPMDEEGGVISSSNISRYTTVPKDKYRFDGQLEKKVIKRTTLSVDCAEKATQRSDYTAATVWVETFDGKHYLIHAARTKQEFIGITNWIDLLAEEFNVDQVLVEDAGAGTQYIQVRALTAGPAPVIPILTKGKSKEFRFDGVSPLFDAGIVLLPESGTDWLADLEHELLAFPNGTNDDYVDTVSQYLAFKRGDNVKRGSFRISAGIRR